MESEYFPWKVVPTLRITDTVLAHHLSLAAFCKMAYTVGGSVQIGRAPKRGRCQIAMSVALL